MPGLVDFGTPRLPETFVSQVCAEWMPHRRRDPRMLATTSPRNVRCCPARKVRGVTPRKAPNDDRPPRENAKANKNTPDLTLQAIEGVFHMKLTQAAAHLGVCPTKLKKTCREFGIKRWPYRKLRMFERLVQDQGVKFSEDFLLRVGSKRCVEAVAETVFSSFEPTVFEKDYLFETTFGPSGWGAEPPDLELPLSMDALG